MTIDDIAKKAGVAKSTVSRYLNNGSVSERTRDKIAAVIEETGYQPNLFASSLKAKNSKMIGIIIPRLDSSSTNTILSGIDVASKEAGYEPVIVNSNLEPANDLVNLRILTNQKVDGILLLATHLTDELVQAIRQSTVPVVVIGQKAAGIHTITHDDYQAGYRMGDHVGQMGHRKSLFFGVTEEDQAVGQTRRQGFYEGFAKHGGESTFLETTFSRKDSHTLAKEKLPAFFETDVTLINCATDNIAIGVMKALHDLGKSIPDDYSLTGFGGYEISNFLTPALTTIRYPFYEIGRKAVSYLLEIRDNPEKAPNEIVLANELVVQDSVKNRLKVKS